jgi:hypothetical protein
VLHIDEGRGAAVQCISGAGHGKDPSAERSMLGDVPEGSETDAHLVQAEGISGTQPNTSDSQPGTNRTLRERHAVTVDGEVRVA